MTEQLCDSPCVEWQGSKMTRGYGRKWIKERKRMEGAHRAAMAEIHGWEALEGKVVMHLCDNPPCVNVDHLRIATQSENMRDWSVKFDNASKTHCPKGHKYAEGQRRCRTCARQWARDNRGKGAWTWEKYQHETR